MKREGGNNERLKEKAEGACILGQKKKQGSLPEAAPPGNKPPH